MNFLGNNCWIILLIVIILLGSDGYGCGCNSCNTANACGCNNGCGCN